LPLPSIHSKVARASPGHGSPREGEPFDQRFTATISDDANTIVGRWEAAKDGATWETDFDLVYRRVS
jgi:hypothetical protein